MTNEEFINSIKLENEEWRDVVGYEGMYAVSNKNRCATFVTEIRDKIGRVQHKKQRLLSVMKVCRNGKYYWLVVLTKNHISLKKYMHKLIADAFIPNPNNYNEIDHIDTNGLNNSIDNLRWCSHKDNYQGNKATLKKMSLSHKGKECPYLYKSVVQLKDNTVVRIYKSINSVSEDGFNPTAVKQSLKKGCKSGGYNWKYLSDCEALVNMSKNSQSTSD